MDVGGVDGAGCKSREEISGLCLYENGVSV